LSATTDTTTCASCGLEFSSDALFCPNCGTAKARNFDGDPLLGTTVGERFLLVERLGHGASGTIYRAEHVTLRRKVAVKVLHEELSRDDLAVERFRREATTVGEIDNEHIVEILDFGRTADGRLYLAMELLEGETLDEVLRREKRLSIDRAVDILIQLGEALMEAHAIGYIHRDLRPRNIYLAVRRKRADFVKLLDFGLAKLVEKEGEAASTSLGMTFGEPKYMSPEQARGDPVDRRADIYSLGCIAYEMLVGEPPFTGKRVFDILSRHVEAPHVKARDRRPDIPHWLDAAVDRMLAKRPEDRFVTVFRLVEALRQGKNTGKIMPGERATRRETDPPPSVVKAMKLHADRQTEPVRRSDTARGLGLRETRLDGGAGGDAAVADPRATVLDGGVGGKAAQVDGRATMLDGGAGSKPAKVDPRATVLDGGAGNKAAEFDGRATALDGGAGAKAEERDPRATALDGGVGAEAASAPQPSREAEDEDMRATVQRDVDRDELRERAAAAGKRTPTRGSRNAGISAAWYADGEELEGEAALDESMRAKLASARAAISPSKTDVTSLDDDFYEPERSRLPLIIAIFAGIVLVIVVLALVWPSGGGDKASSGRESDGGQAVSAEAAGAPSASPTGVGLDAAGAAAATVDGGAKVALAPATSPSDNGTGTAGDKPPRDKPPRDKPPRDKPPRDKPPRDKPPRDEPPLDLLPDDEPPDEPKETHDTPPADTGGGSVSADAVKEAEFFAKLGDKDLRSGDILGAAGNFKKARELDPKNADAVIGLGEIALSQGSYSAAIGHLNMARKMRPKSARVYTLLGEAYLGAGNNDKAADSFKRALKIDPDNARARDGYNEASGSLSDEP